ncbi:TetR/AcrR family transcriptional regulator [Pinirhizobacter soli]|uniref:TetR/AcrR family transcriptional regulator n=1 Tax=Pinirhizobacter soli TaxID=2786953 RepID=UPI00202A33A4|nr:TetR/AcrR family transcriptional regulator [Pinirhizobacter soli]
MQTRKDILTSEIIDHVVRHGLADLSLRPLADAIGTSARLLIYHYKSKEALLGEVLDTMQTRLRQSFAELLQTPVTTGERPLRLFWNWAIDKRNFPYMKLLYELQMLAARSPATYGQYLQRNSVHWTDLIAQALPEDERTTAMTALVGAVFDGLFLEVISTGDSERGGQAIDHFIALVDDARIVRANRAGVPAANAASKRKK